MRRKEKEIANLGQIRAIIDRSVVPLNFGYENNCLYFHSAKDGKKIDMLKANNNVCFEFDIDQEVVPSDNACKFGMKYQSVIGFGKASFIENGKEKQKALDIIMRQYSKKDFKYTYTKEFVDSIFIIKVEIDECTGKQSGVE